MPWTTPSLKQCREMVRDDITSALSGAVLIANSVMRVMADATAAMAHLVLRYIDWLARQLMPDTAETEWLDRHGDIWLVNADETVGRKSATTATGTVTFTGTAGVSVPKATLLAGSTGTNAESIRFETTQDIVIGIGATECPIIAIDGGAAGNFEAGEVLTIETSIVGVDDSVTVVSLYGGTDQETDDELRMRVLERIREPPMGGDSEDYVAWCLQVPGVTRAWSAPLEMGMGTVTVRFMCDDLRATDDPLTSGFPLAEDITAVRAYLNAKRPVAVKDFFVEAPIPEPINFTIGALSDTDASTAEEIAISVGDMLFEKGAPAHAIDGVMIDPQAIYAVWISEAVMAALGSTDHFDLYFADHPMPSNGHIAVLGTITYID